jgi:ATP-dependent DNA helicase RecQ
MDAASQEETLRSAAEGRIKLLYLSPERLRDPRFRAYLPSLPLVQLVVDEAHCISTWGHDFRPDFLDIARLLPADPDGARLPVHALTATATPQVQHEIVDALRMGQDGRGYVKLAGDFVRDNLVFRLYTVANAQDRDALTVGLVQQLVRNQERGGAGIVYVATRKAAMQVARLLRDRNIAAQAYHGAMATPERHQIQERFMQGDLEVVVATTAFGMGVDKAEIRFVLHYDHPSSLEAYAQEAGRAGRDGQEAYAILLHYKGTQRTQRFIARQNQPAPDLLRAYRRALLDMDARESGIPRLGDGTLLCSADTLADLAGIDRAQGRVLFYSFEEAGLVRRHDDCTLDAKLLLNVEPATILERLPEPDDRDLAAALLAYTGATTEHTATYQAGAFYETTGRDPRLVDPLLNRLAAQELVLYRPFTRAMTFTVDPDLAREDQLASIDSRFTARYARFEERLQAMLAYIQLKPGSGRCRGAYLVEYLTGQSDVPPCGKCDLCSPTSQSLPWDPGVRLYGPPVQVDPRLALLGAVRDHDGVFGLWTIERMLLGIPQTTYAGKVSRLSPTARSSDHFGELEGSGITTERLRRTLQALIEGGYLTIRERLNRATGENYQAVAITQRGRDALAGGIALPDHGEASA